MSSAVLGLTVGCARCHDHKYDPISQRDYGTGIVPPPDDFGRTGSPPSNRPPLDFLTRELIESGWSVRHPHRIILGSHAYRMTSRAEHPEARRQACLRQMG